jgi:tetratricopeptide (TPR) repeat protein
MREIAIKIGLPFDTACKIDMSRQRVPHLADHSISSNEANNISGLGSLHMMRLFTGQKRKAQEAFEQLRDTLQTTNQLVTQGEFNQALTNYDESLKTLNSETIQQWMASGLIAPAAWTDQLATALLGRIRAQVGASGRSASFKKAETSMFDVYQLKPDWMEASEYLASLAVSCGDRQGAKFYIEKLFAINPRHPRARFLQAILDFENGEYDETAKTLATLAESAESLCYLARCHLRSWRIEAAIKTFTRAFSRFGPSFDLHYYYGCTLARAQRYEEARQEFQAAATLAPQRVEPMIQLGHLCLQMNDWEGAEKSYRLAMAFGSRASTLTAHYGLALIEMRKGSKQAQAHLDSIRQLDENSEWLIGAEADALERAGREGEARLAYERLSPNSGLYGAVLVRLGLICFRVGDYAGTVNFLRQAWQLRPTDDRLLDVLGAAAAITSDYRLAESAWSQLEARNTIDKKTAHALDHARLWVILETAYQGQAAEAIAPLEALYKKSHEDEAIGRALADVYFIAALEALESTPPGTDQALEYLLLGKHLTSHVKFDYCLALVDLLTERFAAAASRLRILLNAHPKNSGFAYHLGIALLRSGERREAERVFRQGLEMSQKDATRLPRLQWALSVLLFSEQRCAEAIQMLRELVPADTTYEQDAAPQVYELLMRCQALSGDWEAAELLAIGKSSSRQTPVASALLARRNLKTGRFDAALSHLERYLELSQNEQRESKDLMMKAKLMIAQLSLKTAAQRVHEGHFDEAEVPLQNATSLIAGWSEASETWARLNEFSTALRERQAFPQRVERLAATYQAANVDSFLEKEDLKNIEMEIPLVMPPKSQRALDVVDRPVFDTSQWNAKTYPELLLACDS